MKLNHPLIRNAMGLLGSVVMRLARETIDWKALYFDPTTDTIHPQHAERLVHVGWHEYMLFPIALRADPRELALASNHGDGEIISRAMYHLGWSVERGSTTRGGTTALLRMLRDDRRHLNLTPDGPRGPRRKMSTGPIFLASKLGIRILSVGYAYHRPWRLRSWDRFAVPRPYSRARAIFGPALPVPAKLDRDELEAYRLWFENLLNWVTEEAEAWADRGEHRPGEMSMQVGRPSWAMLHPRPVPPLSLPEWLQRSWAELPQAASLSQAIRPRQLAA